MSAVAVASHGCELDELVLSERQQAVLQALRIEVALTDRALGNSVNANQGTLASVRALGLVDCRRVGGHDPLYYLTDFGRNLICAQHDPGGDSPHVGPLHDRKETPMSTTTPEAPATPAAAAKPKNDLKPLYNEIVKTLKTLVSGKSEVKAAYARINAKSGRTVAYVNLPTSRSVRVEIPRAGAPGYDVIKATTDADVPKVVKAVEKFIAAADALAKKKEDEKAAAAAAVSA